VRDDVQTSASFMPPDDLASRRARVSALLPLGDGVLVVGAGRPIPLPENSDQTYPFRSHAEYLYLAGHECADGIIVYDPRAGASGWVSFVPIITAAERYWEGRVQLPGAPLEDFAGWLAARRRRPVALLGVPPPGCAGDAALGSRTREALTHARRVKDAHELSLIRRAAAATAAGFARVRDVLRPGVTERALQIELEAEFCRQGAARSGYATIVGGGPNSAVLHFEPTSRPVREGEFVLIDAGAEVDRYTADVTRTYVAGAPSPFQRDLYQAVREAQERAIAGCVPGAEWKDIHLAAATDLTAALVSMGLLRGSADALVEREAHTLFFPHGVGHMVGLGVRDASGLLPGRRKDLRPSLRTLRMDLPLAAGYVVTVEPGVYFIPALLDDPARRARFHDCVNWPLVAEHSAVGGVRIEDNVLVTGGTPEVLTRGIAK
jgi:Xaa-Pro aminopeptidase